MTEDKDVCCRSIAISLLAIATCYMYGPSLSITDRSVDMYTVHSKNKLNLAS